MDRVVLLPGIGAGKVGASRPTDHQGVTRQHRTRYPVADGVRRVPRRGKHLDPLAPQRQHVTVVDMPVDERAGANPVHDNRGAEQLLGRAVEHEVIGVHVGLQHHPQLQPARASSDR